MSGEPAAPWWRGWVLCRPVSPHPPTPGGCAAGEERSTSSPGWRRALPAGARLNLLTGRPRPCSPAASRFGSRWSLGRSFLPLPQSRSTSCSTRRSMTSTSLMEKFLPYTGERDPQPGLPRACGQRSSGDGPSPGWVRGRRPGQGPSSVSSWNRDAHSTPPGVAAETGQRGSSGKALGCGHRACSLGPVRHTRVPGSWALTHGEEAPSRVLLSRA